MSSVSKDTELTPVKKGKRKAEPDCIDLTGNNTVSTPSPLKKAKAATEPNTPSQRARKTLTPKSNTPKASVTPKTNPSSALCIPAGDDSYDYDHPESNYDYPPDYGTSSDGPDFTWEDIRECANPYGPYPRALSHASRPRAPRKRIQFQKLDLLNGHYTVTAPAIARQLGPAAAAAAAATELSLVLTLGGNSLWGKFELGAVVGILYFAERPLHSAAALREFRWRGLYHDGHLFGGEDNKGTVQFIGGGRVKCCLQLRSGEELSFDGNRDAGQNTTSPIHARDMESEWFEYV